MSRAAGVALSGAFLTLAALLFDAAPLFVPGVALTMLGGATPLWLWGSARNARVHRSLPVQRVLEDEPLEATIEVHRGLLGLPGGQILDPLLGTPVSLGRPRSTATGADTQVKIVARFPRRGLHRVEPPSLLVRDPLELASAIAAGAGPTQDLLVLPRTERVRWGDRGGGSEGSDAGAWAHTLAAVDVDGLRPYRPGSPASRIHWPALARGAGLLERRLRADDDPRPLVVLDARGAGPAEHLDAAVRATASLTLELARSGGCRLLLGGARRAITVEPDLSAWAGVHARLALVEGGPATRAPLLGPGARLGPMFYVAAEAPERLPEALAGAGGASCVLVLPAQLQQRLRVGPSFSVAGCLGFVLRARGAHRGRRVA